MKIGNWFQAEYSRWCGGLGRRLWVRVGWLQWDFGDWSLSRRDRAERNMWRSMFSLRCVDCGRWTWGCKDHWFCGFCESCRLAEERDYLYGNHS